MPTADAPADDDGTARLDLPPARAEPPCFCQNAGGELACGRRGCDPWRLACACMCGSFVFALVKSLGYCCCRQWADGVCGAAQGGH